MELRWTEDAALDLERIADYLFEQTPEHALELMRTLYNAPAALLSFPHRGRPGEKAETRELVLSPLPYLVVYRVLWFWIGDDEAYEDLITWSTSRKGSFAQRGQTEYCPALRWYDPAEIQEE